MSTIRGQAPSLVVGGLVGMLAVTRFVRPPGWAAMAAGYRVFFVCYLAGLALDGPVVGAIAGSVLTGITVAFVARSRFAGWALTVGLVLVVGGSIVLVATHDQHGVAVLLGLAVALVTGHRKPGRIRGPGVHSETQPV